MNYTIRHRLLVLLAILCCAIVPTRGDDPPRIDVILWFDTEDYILPASDDAALRLATWLTDQQVKATFKVVGEKARTLEQRGRTDVITALKKHEIGYHSNWHSVPPTPAQYLDRCDWHEGIAEFNRREKPGYDDITRIFGTAPTCYGQPGSSWGPQSHPALHSWGMRIYLDAGQHLNVDGKPFWYGGLLNFYRLTQQIRTGLAYPHELEQARIRFLQARDQLRAEGGGVVSIVYHPCEFIHQEFWDGVNFKHGANPPRDQWKLPRMKSEQAIKQAYDNFEQYILFMKKFPEVRFVTATEAAAKYVDRTHQHEWTIAEIKALLNDATIRNWHAAGIHWLKTPHGYLSAAELFWLATQAMTAQPASVTRWKLPELIQGPAREPREPVLKSMSAFSLEEMRRASLQVKEYLQAHQQIPSEVWLGSQAMTPEAYLLGIACHLDNIPGISASPVGTKQVVRLHAQDSVSPDVPQLWRWVIFPPGFQAPNLMAHAKRQAWTLKPGTRQP
ncbi:MAG: hypothetical protein U0796_12410 [Gemmatales bacterium]